MKPIPANFAQLRSALAKTFASIAPPEPKLGANDAEKLHHYCVKTKRTFLLSVHHIETLRTPQLKKVARRHSCSQSVRVDRLTLARGCEVALLAGPLYVFLPLRLLLPNWTLNVPFHRFLMYSLNFSFTAAHNRRFLNRFIGRGQAPSEIGYRQFQRSVA